MKKKQQIEVLARMVEVAGMIKLGSSKKELQERWDIVKQMMPDHVAPKIVEEAFRTMTILIGLQYMEGLKEDDRQRTSSTSNTDSRVCMPSGIRSR